MCAQGHCIGRKEGEPKLCLYRIRVRILSRRPPRSSLLARRPNDGGGGGSSDVRARPIAQLDTCFRGPAEREREPFRYYQLAHQREKVALNKAARRNIT